MTKKQKTKKKHGGRRRAKRMRKLKYILFNSLVYSVIFLSVYQILIKPLPNTSGFIVGVIPMPNWQKFGWIFVTNLGLHILISWAARMLFGYGENMKKPFNKLVRNFTESVIMSVLVWVGMVGLMLENWSWAWTFLVYMAVKTFIHLFADQIGDTAAFGG